MPTSRLPVIRSGANGISFDDSEAEYIPFIDVLRFESLTFSPMVGQSISHYRIIENV